MEHGTFMRIELRSLRAALRQGPALALALSMGFAAVSPVAAQSLTDRFKSLFGGKSDEQPAQAPAQGPAQAPAPAGPQEDMDCPSVTVRAGASTYAVAVQGKQAIGNDVRFQAS